MEKFSVKKPFTVLVAVIMVLMLGFVSITKMKTNLLPNVSTPYLMVVTVYPGASPERVETEVSDVLQNALTVPGVENITATSAENYSLLLMKFVDDTDMNSALVQVSNKLDQAKSDLPETALTPSVIQYSMNMNAFMTVAVSREGSSVYDLSDFIKNTMTPYVQRKGGVSSVSSSGLVEQLVQVQLNQEKVDAINEKLMELIDTQLEVAHTQLEEAEAKIKAGRAEYDKQFKNFGNTVSNTVMGSLSSEVGSAVEVVRKQAEGLPLYYTEWSSCATFGAPGNDTRKTAAYDVRAALSSEDVIDGSSIWCFSDIFEEIHPFPEEFHGGFGMMTQHGIPKPIFHALRLLGQAGDKRLELPGALDGEVSVAAFRDAADTQLTVLATKQNLHHFAGQSTPATPVEIEVELDAKPQSVQLCRIDEEHGTPLKCWQAMGEPEDMTPAQVQQVIEESAVDYAPAPYEYADGKLTVKTELVTNDLAFIRIVK